MNLDYCKGRNDSAGVVVRGDLKRQQMGVCLESLDSAMEYINAD